VNPPAPNRIQRTYTKKVRGTGPILCIPIEIECNRTGAFRQAPATELPGDS
jgi:hypothetical protein